MSLIYLILGGNMGHPEKIISDAISLICRNIGAIEKISSLYESESWGFSSDNFINQALIVATKLSPAQVLDQTQKIEKVLGRRKSSNGYEARTIDIDILYYENLIITMDKLRIPHPLIAQRRFVLEPLAEIAPDYIDPKLNLPVIELLKRCNDKLMVRKIK